MTIAFLSVGLIACAISVTVLTYLVIQTNIELKAMQKSTHQIQYVRSDEFDKLNETTREKLEKEFFDNIQ